MATSTDAPTGSGRTNCSADVLKAIYGDKDASKSEVKAVAYDQSLQNWWGEYSARKNDEEEEHVADSLLYDERCHLPRSAPAPKFITKPYDHADVGARGVTAVPDSGPEAGKAPEDVGK